MTGNLEGPCHFVDGETEPSLNEYSWNTYSNMLYVDQPIGVGFSYGTDSATSTITAAEYVWAFLQNFYAAFPTYESRDFALFTESYGGHYGPEFASYFLSQNEAIDAGTVSGEKINLVALGINNVSEVLGECVCVRANDVGCSLRDGLTPFCNTR